MKWCEFKKLEDPFCIPSNFVSTLKDEKSPNLWQIAQSGNAAVHSFLVSDMELLTGIYLPIFLIFQIVKKINKYLLRNEEDYLG